ncbi:MAG TPA: hypothetical protein VF636_00005, partial [Sphingomonas sp.]
MTPDAVEDALARLRDALPAAEAADFWNAARDLLGRDPSGSPPRPLIELGRLLIARAWRHDEDAPADLSPHPATPPPIAAWIRAALAWARFDHAAARDELSRALERWPRGPVDFRAERALLAIRFGEYGLALADLPAADAPSAGRYAPLAEARAVVEAVPPDAGALYPEYVIDVLIDRAPDASYSPRPGHVLTVLETLAPGGTERQAVSVVEALSRDGRVASQLLLVER